MLVFGFEDFPHGGDGDLDLVGGGLAGGEPLQQEAGPQEQASERVIEIRREDLDDFEGDAGAAASRPMRPRRT